MESHGSQGGLSPVMRTTATYLLAGFGLLLLGAAVQPRFKAARVQSEEERILFPELSDASKAAGLRIVRYDDELATLREFKVVQAPNGVWVLPSHDNYPADAKDQLAGAATELVDLQSIEVVSQSPGDHEGFGVIEPDPEKLKPGMTGVGELVEISDASGGKLARLIVGKEVKKTGDAAVGGRPQRYVRKAGQDPVYQVELDLAKFPTDFGQWIEKDLLKLSPWDVRRVVLDDYLLAAVEAGGRLRVEQQRKNRIELGYDDKDSKWSLVKLEVFDPTNPSVKPKEEKLGENEELASAKLNQLRDALGDLKIIDVARKPAGLSADLKAEESFMGDEAARRSLQQRGFLPRSSGDGKSADGDTIIQSADGETIIGMKNGVEYVLRFGATTSVATDGKEDMKKDGEKKEADSKEDASKEDGGETGGRYVLVMARVNESLLEKPKLEAVPDAPPEKAAEPSKGEPEKKDTGRVDGRSPFRLVALRAEEADAKPSAASTDGAAGAAGGAAGAADGAKKEPSAADTLKAADEAEAKMQAAIEERRRVERENRRKQDEYEEKVKAAKKKVRELNNRFADWYYVVSDKEYAKIHLGRADIVKAKEKADEAKNDGSKDAAKP